MNPSSDSANKVGRPRKWASEAERQRAYRQRRAVELADPLALRAAFRQARRDLSAALDAARRAQHENSALRRRNAELTNELDQEIARHQDLFTTN